MLRKVKGPPYLPKILVVTGPAVCGAMIKRHDFLI
jgi:hypothetical protein